MSSTRHDHIDDATWKTMLEIKARSELDAVELACYRRREALIFKAAAEGLTPTEIEQAQWLETSQRRDLDAAAERREQSEE